jgi:polysaccharide export outer membrane protein
LIAAKQLACLNVLTTYIPPPMLSICPSLLAKSLSSYLRLLLGLLTLACVHAAPGDPAPAPAPAPLKPTDGTYILRPNDGIRLEVYDEPELSTSVQILKTGQASFPLIGSVEIGGLSVDSAANKIRELYLQDYLVDPKVTLAVSQYATDYISVIGEVKNPGQLPIPVAGKLDLATAMATAGGLTETADASSIRLVRASGATLTYAMSSIISGASGRVDLAAGDRIIVNQSAFVGKSVTVLGKVGRQGPLQFPMTGKLDLVQAIALAGGMMPNANPRKVSINRKGTVTVVDYKEISQRGDRPYFLQPDDIINVPESIF